MNEDIQNYLNSIRRDFSGKPLEIDNVDSDPLKQFEVWFEEAVNSQLLDPYAMSLSTVQADGQPSTRIVYMRGIKNEGFVFYTNYDSEKGKSLETNGKVALNFFWGELERQIRIEGIASKLESSESDLYFSKRPRESQLGAWASSQSNRLENRKELEDKVEYFTEKFKGVPVPRPENWGGYLVTPHGFEFWQGRPNRLHDRIVYLRQEENWECHRLSP